MVEIDFGTLATAVVNEMNCTASELFGDEVTDRDLAAKRYSRNVIGAIRQVFDEAEARADVPAPTTCSRCGVVLEGEGRFCTRCGTPITSDAVRERITDLMLRGIRDDMRKAVERLEHDEPERYGRLAAIVTGRIG